MSINKHDFISKVAEAANITKKQAEEAVNSSISIITETLKAGDKIQFVGFGTFEAVGRQATMKKNPKTGAEVAVPAKIAPKFKAGKALKDAVNGK